MWLIVRSGPDPGRSIELAKDLVVGRDPSCDFRLRDEKVSRQHAFIRMAADGRITLKDLGSSNGTIISGRRIGRNDGPTQVEAGDTLRFGDTTVLVSMSPPTKRAIVDLNPGDSLGRYRIVREVARGGNGIVFEAEHSRTGKRVAIKVLRSDLFSSEKSRRRFIAEARTASRLEHPNVITVYDADEIDDLLFIAMRLVVGENLQTILEREQRLPVDRLFSLLIQIAAALDAAHAVGLVHRDVKPMNILVTTADDPEGEGKVFLADFGISKDLTAEAILTTPGRPLGTIAYMAPEQITGGEVDGRTDEYALACVAFEMLTGQPPYASGGSRAAMSEAHVLLAPPSPREVRADLPPAVDLVFARAMAKAKEDRFAGESEFVAALRAAFVLPPDTTIVVPRPTTGQVADADPAAPSAGSSTAPAPGSEEFSGTQGADINQQSGISTDEDGGSP